MSRPAGGLGPLLELRCRVDVLPGLVGAWQGQARGMRRLAYAVPLEVGLEVVCADHGERTPAATRAAAGRTARTPDLWCSGCRDGAQRRGPLDGLGRPPVVDYAPDGRPWSDVRP